jgi:hypothetical protein
VQCIAQSIVHRNASPAMSLYEALPKGQRHDSLVAYFEKFGNLAYSKTEKKVVFFDVAKHTDQAALEWSQEYASEVSAFQWVNGTKKPDPKSAYDVSEEVGKLLERLSKIAADSTKDVKNKALLDELVGVYNAYSFKTHEVVQTAPMTDDDKEFLLEEAADRLEASMLLDNITV